MSVYNLMVRIGADTSGLTKGLRGVVGDFKQSFGDIAKIAAGNVIADAVAGLGRSMLGVGKSAIVMAGELEQTKVAFGTMLGSAEKADSFLRDLATFAANTPFEMRGLQDSSKKLLAFGFEAQQVIPMMTAIGNAVGGLGGGAAEINRVTMALGQMQAKGKVSAEEMMQLAELGIPAWDMLAKSIGVSVPEAMKLAQKGAIPAGAAIEGLVNGMNERFPDMMAKQSKTLLGSWGNLQDGISAVLVRVGTEFTQTFDVTGILQKASEAVGGFAQAIDNLGLGGALNQLFSPELKAVIIGVAGAITVAMIPAVIAAGSAIAAAAVAAAPFIAAGAAIAAAAYVIIKNWDPIKGFFTSLWNNLISGVTAFAEGFKSRFGFIGQIVQTVAQFILDKFQWAFKLLPQGMQDAIKNAGNAVMGLPAMAMPALQQTAKATADTFKGMTNGAKVELGKLPGIAGQAIKETGEAVKAAELSFQGLYAAFRRIDTEAKYLGTSSIDVLRQKIQALESQIRDTVAFEGPLTPQQQAAFDQAVKSLEEYRKRLKDAEAAQKDLGKSAKEPKSALQNLQASVSDVLASVNGLRDGLTTMAAAFGINAENAVLGAVAAMGNFAMAGVQVWTSVSTLIPQLYSMGVAMHAALGPIGLVTGAVALLAAGISFLVGKQNEEAEKSKKAAEETHKAWQESVKKISDTFQSGFANSVGDTLKRYFSGDKINWLVDLTNGIREAVIDGMIQALVQSSIIKGKMGELMDQLATAVATGNTGLVNSTIAQIKEKLPEITAFIEDAAGKLKGVVDFQLPEAGSKTAPQAPNLESFAAPVALPYDPKKVVEDAKGALEWATRRGWFGIALTGDADQRRVFDDVNSMGRQAASLGDEATAEALRQVMRNAGQVPLFANGGIVTGPTLGMIGEAGDDEAILPLNDSTFERLGAAIANATREQDGGNGSQGVTVNVTIHAGASLVDDSSLDQFARAIGIRLNNLRMQAL